MDVGEVYLEKLNFDNFIEVLNKWGAETDVLIGVDIYDKISVLQSHKKSSYNFIKCESMENRLVFFCKGHPLSNKAILMSNLFDLDRYLSEIPRNETAFKNSLSNHQVQIVSKNHETKEFVLTKNQI